MRDNHSNQKNYRDNLKEEQKNPFVTARNSDAISAFEESVETHDLEHLNVDNQLLLDYTPLIRGRVKYSDLRRDRHLSHLKAELIARGVNAPNDIETKIRSLIILLKSCEGDESTFQPVTDAANFE